MNNDQRNKSGQQNQVGTHKAGDQQQHQGGQQAQKPDAAKLPEAADNKGSSTEGAKS